MKTLSVEIVKKMHLEKGVSEFFTDEDTFVTKGAKDYIEAEGLCLKTNNAPVAGEEEAKAAPLAKPEHMTHLCGLELVEKSHPRIRLRGMLDSFQAEILCLQAEDFVRGDRELLADLEEILSYCRNILGCEVTGKPLPPVKLFGFDEKKLREVSQNPKQYFGVGHVPPTFEMGKTCVYLNRMRTKSREVELAGIHAFCCDGKMLREDIVQALNRLSSGIYILFLKQLAKGGACRG